MSSQEQIDRAQRYVLRIRNRVKREYASAWLGWQVGLLEHAPVHPKNLSVMGGQAVRIALGMMLETGREVRHE